MMTIVITYLEIILAMIVLSLVFSVIVKKDTVQKVYGGISWLIRVSFIDLVKMIIFIRPVKKYADQVAIGLWLILAFVTGRYILLTRPQINEIPGVFIPMIGFIYYISVLYIIKFGIWLSRKAM